MHRIKIEKINAYYYFFTFYQANMDYITNKYVLLGTGVVATSLGGTAILYNTERRRAIKRWLETPVNNELTITVGPNGMIGLSVILGAVFGTCGYFVYKKLT